MNPLIDKLLGFEAPVEVLILGLVTGLVYAVLGIGLTLVYKTSRVINFAHGDMGALAAGLIPVLVIAQGWDYKIALPLALLTAMLAGGAMELLVIRKLARSSRLIVLVATIGMSQLFFTIQTLLPKGNIGTATFPVPFDATIQIGSLILGPGPLLIILVVPVVCAALALFFRYTSVGLAARAAAENEDAAQLVGISVRKVSLVVWTIAGLSAGIAAVLVGPTRPLTTGLALGPALMVRALAAAMIGGLSSLSTVFAGGIFIGVVEAVVTWNFPNGGTLDVVLFLVIVASLLLRRGLGTALRGGGDGGSFSASIRALPPTVAALPKVRLLQRTILAVMVAGAVALPLALNNGQRVSATSVLLFAVMGLSVVVLTGFAGQISLGQFAFVAIGAIVGGRMQQLGYPPMAGLLFAITAGGLSALIIGLPALKLRGLFLAATSLAFAVAGQTWLFGQDWLVHVENGASSLLISRPTLLGVDFQDELSYYWLCLGVLCVVAALVAALRRSGVGRAMIAIRDNERAAASLGLAPIRTKLIAFMLSGMIAATGGYFYGGLLVSFDDRSVFDPSYSLVLVGLAVFGGVTSIVGAIIGALWIRGLAYVIGPIVPHLLGSQAALIISGVGLVAAVLQFPSGVAAAVYGLRDRMLPRLFGMPSLDVAEEFSGNTAVTSSRPRLEPAEAFPSSVLHVLVGEGITVDFGGQRAVNGVTITAAAGEIVGLVGPNGAGKTTLFDVLSGQLRPSAGHVSLHGRDVTDLRPEQRARLGLGRTFQQARLFDDLRLVDVFKVALECEEPSEVVPSMLTLPPSRRAERAKSLRAEEIVDLLGLRAFASRRVAECSTGTRRLAELGTMIALGADVLLLDEPAAGVAQREVEALATVLREVRAHLGAAMVLVEHDIPLVTGLADRMYVLASGVVIAEGPPAQIREDPAVIAAYLGTDERVIQRSGRASGAALQQRVLVAPGGKP